MSIDFEEKAKKIGRIEFWVATIIYVIALVLLLGEQDELQAIEYPGAPVIIPLSPLWRELLQQTVVYGAFVFLTLYVVPRLIRRENIGLNLIWVALTVITVGIFFGSVFNGIEPISVFAVYSAFKHGMIYLWASSGAIRSRFPFVAPGVLLTVTLWLISVVLFVVGEADRDVIATWVTMIPSGILLYSYSFFSFIPAALKGRRPLVSYLWKVTIMLVVASAPIGIVGFSIVLDTESAMTILFLNGVFQLLVTTPFSWIFYKRHKQGADELVSLQKELGQSTANFDFLRSQINPHFLFNAMNTLYGTAIQEKADRTAEAIQKLGDMMRFMLHENIQAKILVAREIEYLRNYIALQRLRTDTIPGVTIQTEIDEHLTMEQISPMLLIPFVENAFKHGISFREPSFIKISLDLIGKVLHFDVTNSRHARPENDPEKDKSGIGLTNVKQRLQLLYPDRYALTVHEAGREFFIHLTIQLS